MMSEPTIGPFLRQLRVEAGRSQTEQAEMLSAISGRPVTRNEVSRWENEGRLLTPYWQRHYAATFNVPERDLQCAVRLAKRRRRVGSDGAQEGGDVFRRQFVGAAIASVAGLALPGVAGSGALGGRISLTMVDGLAARMPRLRNLDNYLGGADTYLVYAAELESTRALLNQATYAEAAGRALRALIAEQSQQAGWAAFDAGHQAVARVHFDESLSAATEAGEAALAGNALALMAYQVITAGNPATDLASAACETAGSGVSAPVRALLREREAWAHAVGGNADETERALGAAQEALASDDGNPAPDWAAWVDHREIQIMTGRCWSTLRRPLRAAPVLEQVLADFPRTHARDRALYLTWLASAYLDAGEVEHSAAVVGEALDLSSAVGSVRPRHRTNMLLKRLEPHRDLVQVQELLDRAAS